MVSTDPKSNTGSAIAAKVGSQATRSPGQKGSTGLDVASDASKTPVGTSVSESAGSSGGGSSYREGSGNPADAFDFMKSAYFVVVISLSIIVSKIHSLLQVFSESSYWIPTPLYSHDFN